MNGLLELSPETPQNHRPTVTATCNLRHRQIRPPESKRAPPLASPTLTSLPSVFSFLPGRQRHRETTTTMSAVAMAATTNSPLPDHQRRNEHHHSTPLLEANQMQPSPSTLVTGNSLLPPSTLPQPPPVTPPPSPPFSFSFHQNFFSIQRDIFVLIVSRCLVS